MKIHCFTVGAFQVNTYLLQDEETGQCAIVDTGEGDELIAHLRAMEPVPDIVAILLTHAHVDHAGGLAFLQYELDAPTYLPKLEKPMFDTLPYQGDWFGMPELNRPCGRIDHWIDDGATIQLGRHTLHFISTPGHTPGQGCYYDAQDIFVGDTLFAGSIGRTDLPMGDPELMQYSLKRLMQLPGQLRVHCGHGPETSLQQERLNNPYLQFLR